MKIELYATAVEDCYEISSNGSVLCEELRSTQEEAQTRLLLHAYHVGRNICATVVIPSDDADVLVLCLAFKSFIPSTVYIKCGTQARTRYIHIIHVVNSATVQSCVGGFLGYTLLRVMTV